ncbi:MAG: hypothetical protein JST43_09310 [Bacteroidetes bacterium]|nr:hypothetical protein [Bacteroidota bacterium]MBS1539046.1 hypothetical protein [Bacteroidota bacterium]
MYKTLLFFLFFAGLSLWTCGQDAVQNFQILDVDKGLSQNSVYGMYQDKRGFLWIGTADALNRYDGKKIKYYRAPFNPSEPYNANYIRGNIAEDKNENLWYYTENGLYRYNRKTDQVEKIFSPQKAGLKRVDFKVVFVDDRQRVWLFNSSAGIAYYTIGTGEFKLFSFPTQLNQADYFPRDAKRYGDCIWYGVNLHDGLYRFNTRTLVTDHFFENEAVAFIRLKKGGYYKADFSTIHYYDSTKKTTEIISLPLSKPNHISIVSLSEDEYAHVWIATRHEGLWKYERQTKQITHFQNQVFNNTSIPTNNLTGLLMDRNKNLWVSTEGAGVGWLSTKSPLFKSSIASQQQNLKANLFVRSIAEDSKQNIWIASLQNPIYQLTPPTGQIKTIPQFEKLKISNASFLKVDTKKNIWIGQDATISKLDSAGNLVAQSELHSTFPLQFNRLIELNDGRMMLAWTGGLATILQKGKSFQVQRVVENFSANDVAEMANGSLWVGAKNIGLRQYAKTSEGYQLKQVFFDNLDVKSIHFDQKDPHLIWLATDLGLVRFNEATQQYKVLTEKDGLNNSYVYGILEDKKERLWCSTNGGISCLDKITGTIINYTSKDGLQSNEFNSGAFYEGASGNFYFGGVKGLNWFNPKESDADSTLARSTITEFFVNDRALTDSIILKNKLELSHLHNDLSIRFSVFDFSKPESNKVKFQLLGWDEKPLTTYNLYADYKNLTPGKYTLVYSASTGNQHWGKEQRFYITILSPFWQRWWFYVSVIALTIVTIAFLVEYVIRQRYRLKIIELEKQNALERERRRISMEMHDDIGASLTQITLISELAKHQPQKEDSFNQIAQTSRQVVLSMNEIIWSLNPDHKTFEQLMSYLRDQLHNILEPSGINYSIVLPEQGNFSLNHILIRNLILVIKEATNNALKHAQATTIEIEGTLKGNNFSIQISDNGIGFEPKEGMAGNGLRNIARRVKEMEGRWEVTSASLKGTTLTVHIKLTVE